MTSSMNAVDAVDGFVDHLPPPQPRRPLDVDFDSFREVNETKLETNNERQRRFVTPKDFVSGEYLLFVFFSSILLHFLTHTRAPSKHTKYNQELLKVIGMGAFGKVLQVRNKHNDDILAMKVISKRLLRKKGDSLIENILIERDILKKIRNHPFIVTMHCSFQVKEKLFIIMDFLAGGELFLRLGREGIFLEETAAFYLAEIILALDHLHSQGILHRDLKPENILMGSDGHVCLTDFGLAKDFGELNDERALTICGTQEYMAPEMIARQGYGPGADYWSLGCIAYEMLKGQPPFESRQGRKVLFSKIMSEKVKMPPGSSAPACKLLKGLLNRNVLARLGTARTTMFEVGGVAGLKQHPFFADMQWELLEKKNLDPPAKFDIQKDCDTTHFHEEFTQMALPRSVIEMGQDEFRARRVDSEKFRGFSFIHEDFQLPSRNSMDEKAYWDHVDEDGESASEAASSKMGDEVAPPTDPPKKKRPARKRKKKKNGVTNSAATTPVASTVNTPLASAANTPAPSEDGELSERLEQLALSESTTPIKADPSPPSNSNGLTVASNPTPALLSVEATPVAKKPSKPSEEQWQSAGKSKTANRTKKHTPPLSNYRTKQHQGSQPTNGSWATNTPKERRETPIQQQRNRNGVRSTPTSASRSTNQPQPLQRRPSTDWRIHSMSPRSGGSPSLGKSSWPSLSSNPNESDQSKTSWPSLSNAPPPPLTSKPDLPKASPGGAWAARTAKR